MDKRKKTDFERVNSPFVDKIIESITIHLISLKSVIIIIVVPSETKDYATKSWTHTSRTQHRNGHHMILYYLGTLTQTYN